MLASSAPLERYVCSLCARLCVPSQQGGGLHIYGTATLTDSKVYSNVATVRSPYESDLRPPNRAVLRCLARAFLRCLELSSVASLDVCSLSACRRPAAGSTWRPQGRRRCSTPMFMITLQPACARVWNPAKRRVLLILLCAFSAFAGHQHLYLLWENFEACGKRAGRFHRRHQRRWFGH